MLAKFWGVSPTRVSHRTREGDNALTEVCALVEHPQVDSSAIVACVLEAYERKALSGVERTKLVARLDALLMQEHTIEARQNRALQSRQGMATAVREHQAALCEIAALLTVLGMGDDV